MLCQGDFVSWPSLFFVLISWALLLLWRWLGRWSYQSSLHHGLLFLICSYSDADWAGDPTDIRSTMAYCFLSALILTLTLIGSVILPTVAPPWLIVSYSAPLPFLGVVRSRLLLPDLVLRLSTVHLPMLQLNFCGYDSFWQTWVLLIWLVPLFVVIIGAQSRLFTMMSSMSAPSILKLIVTSFGTIFSRALSIFDLSPLKINLPIFSRSLILLVGYVILFPSSSWLHHLEFEGGCWNNMILAMFVVEYFRNIISISWRYSPINYGIIWYYCINM